MKKYDASLIKILVTLVLGKLYPEYALIINISLIAYGIELILAMWRDE